MPSAPLPPPSPPTVTPRVLGVLAVAVLGISCAAPLVRAATAPALTVATWRLALSLPIIAVALLLGGGWREWRALPPRLAGLALAGGVLLALHFWSWNASLTRTSVAASVVLVNLQPAIVLPVAARWLGERPTAAQRRGVWVAMLGAAIVAAGDGWTALAGGFASSRALVGDLLALLGAGTAAAYYLIGRRLRVRLSLWPYVGLVYGACLVVLALLALATGAPLTPVAPRELAIYAGLAAGPMLLGHTGLNWALGHAPAYLVNVAVLGEPVGATLLAWLLPGIGERPPVASLLGGAVVLAGLWLATARGPDAGPGGGPASLDSAS